METINVEYCKNIPNKFNRSQTRVRTRDLSVVSIYATIELLPIDFTYSICSLFMIFKIYNIKYDF